MSYELSFAPEFFFAEGEPYDGGPEHGDRPTTVWGAIMLAMEDPEQLADFAAILGCKPEHVSPEALMDNVAMINTCSNLNSPVRVWLDSYGDVTVKVWDR